MYLWGYFDPYQERHRYFATRIGMLIEARRLEGGHYDVILNRYTVVKLPQRELIALMLNQIGEYFTETLQVGIIKRVAPVKKKSRRKP